MQEALAQSFRLSPLQKHIYQLQQKKAGPGHPFLSTRCLIQINGPLHISRLQQALNMLADRHEILRTTFHALPDMAFPSQVIATEARPAFQIYDIRHLPCQRQEEMITSIESIMSNGACSLHDRVICQATLILSAENAYQLILSLPTMNGDPATWDILLRELVALYAGDPVLDEPLQYADLAEWQYELLEAAEMSAGKAYWTNVLATKTPGEEILPGEKSQNEGENLELSARLSAQVPEELVPRLEAYAQRAKISLKALIMTSWFLVLTRLCQRDELLLGLAYDGRDHDALKDAIGLLTCYLPFTCQLRQDLSCREATRCIQEKLDEMQQWQEGFFWELQAQSSGPATSDGLYTFGFAYEEASPAMRSGELTFALERKDSSLEHFKVGLTCTRSKREIQGVLSYNSSLYQEQDMHGLLRRWQMGLEQLITLDTAPLKNVNTLLNIESQKLLDEWNRTSETYPHNTCIHTLIEEQGERTPDRIAVVSEDEQLTFSVLDARANGIANILQQYGAGPEVGVGLYLHRSIDMVIGLLGILKAGSAYIPLDPAMPQQRLVLLLRETQLSLILTQQEQEKHLPDTRARIICLDDREIWWQESSRPACHVLSENSAYILYTSGSTGDPKGVVVTHRGLVNYLCWARKAYAIENGSGSLLHSPLTFDLTVTALFPPLLAGLPLRLVSQDNALEELSRAVEQSQHLSLLKLTPAHLDLLEYLLPGEVLRGKTNALVIGGEALYSENIRFWHEYAPETRLINEYGPTETVVGCCVYEVPTEQWEEGPVPIGHPIANTRLYVLDRWFNPVSIGVTGELYIGGAGVARGYLHRPDLTAERFLPDPYKRGERLYKTGDLVRYRSDGTLVYAGRQDHQVKMRGYRIEPGEIEAALLKHPQVREAVVLTRALTEGGMSLVAYVVAQEQNPPLDRDLLLAYLQEQLPEYMVPADVLILQAMPLTENGKIDRLTLPFSGQTIPEIKRVRRMPRNGLEELLVEIWRDILGSSSIGIDDNFFEQGGHSLLATRLIARIQDLLHVEVSLRKLFQEPTIVGLTMEIQRLRQGGRFHLPLPIGAELRDRPLPLSFAQQRLWFLDQLEGESLTYLIPIAYTIHGTLKSRLFEKSLQWLIQRHESLRTTFQIIENQPVQVIHQGTRFSLPIIDLQGLQKNTREEEQRRLARQERLQPCDLSRGPLLRVTLVQVQENVQMLLLTIHHIITDGWSQEVLFRELLTYYRGLLADVPVHIPDLPIQYADFALWQRRWLQGEILEGQVAYWQHQLTGAVPLELPTDYPRPARQTFRGRSLPVQISRELQNSLNELSRREGLTLFMVLLASFQILLVRYSGQSDISVGTPVANRTRVELEGLIGFFVNTLVLRIDLADNPSVREALRRVREVALDAYDHQDLPFEQLVEILQPERDLSRNPLFQVMFILQNAPRALLQDLDLDATTLASEHAVAKFDLTLSLIETDQGLKGQIDYSQDLYQESTIKRMLAHWQILLEAMVAHPEQTIDSLPLLTPLEQQHYFQEWNNTAKNVEDKRMAPQQITWQVEHIPDAIAASCDEYSLSYQELNRQASVIANHLRSRGANVEIPVALLSDRDLTFLSGMLAVFKSGAVYLPLDPLFPLTRLRQMIQQSHCFLILTTSTYLPLLEQVLDGWPEENLPHVIALEPLLRQYQDVAELPGEDTPSHLAYMIYTSGSTGNPKGVMVERRGMLNHLSAKITDVDLTSTDTLAQNGPPCFDISLWQCLAPLMVGGRVQLFRDEIAFQPERLVQQIEEKGVSVLQLVPDMLRNIIHSIETTASPAPHFSALRWIVPTGDALPAELCHQWLRLYPQVPLLNTYGSTECSDDQCHYPITRVEEIGNTPIVTIGRPIPNMRVYVLDASLEMVPVGVIGELYLGGTGVGRGYLDAPDRTALAFLPDRFAPEGGARLYKTGDRVRYHTNGTLEFLGRVDHLVKIRGYRIELGEIEAVLSQHPLLRVVVVVPQAVAYGAQQLVAYVVGEATLVSPVDLRTYLQGRLPDYMIPQHFVILETLPLTGNGKIDRKALPRVDSAQMEQAAFSVAPRTPAEELIAAIWQDVLQKPQVGALDNFFALGGHSLLATSVVARLSAAFQVNVPLRSIFETPTVEGLAGELARIHGDRASLDEIALVIMEIEQMSNEQVMQQLGEENS